MQEFKLTTPVALFIFNRPATTRPVFETIRRMQPQRLLIVADGPRSDHPDDGKRCEDARRIVEQIDWDCEVLRNYADKNLGCRRRVSSGLDWVFENVEEAIILEDDCLPSRSFFRFCQELLGRYRYNSMIMHIAGTNSHFGRKFGEASYFFSRYNLVWGWATWRRAWRHYDVDMKSFPAFKKSRALDSILYTQKERKSRMDVYARVYENRIDTWDYQWHYATRINNGLAIHPNVNLIQNIGFGEDATHTKVDSRKVSENLAREISFPLLHPDFILANREADDNFYVNNIHKSLALRTVQGTGAFLRRLLSCVKRQ